MASDFLSYFNLNATFSIQIDVSEHLDADQISQIEQSVSRISNAVKDGDLSLAIGSAKDLSESMAKIAIYSAGESFASSDSFKSLISSAHKAMDRHPNNVAEIHPSFRTIIQAQKNIVGELSTFRNDFGTGHGHARMQQIEQEIALTSLEAALIWCRWVMRRLDDLLANSPNTLRKQLDDGTSFYKGDLTRKLRNIGLSSLEEVSQRAIGVSVARRARTGTFNVTEEGIDACLNKSAIVKWTQHYKIGLILGLVSNTEGQIYLSRESIKKVRRLLITVNDLPRTINFLIENLTGMRPASRFEDIAFKNEILDDFRVAIENHKESVAFWDFLTTVLNEENS